MTRTEMETTIRWDAAERLAYIDTTHPATIRKLDRLVATHPDAYKLVRDDTEAKRYTAPASFIRFGKPASEARRKANRTNSGLKKPHEFVDSDKVREPGW